MSDSRPSKFSSDDMMGANSMAKGDYTRRSWTDREEETLVLALKELVVNGWKSDNRFRERVGHIGSIDMLFKDQARPVDELSTHRTTSTRNGKKRNSKKRNSNDNVEGLIEMLGKMHNYTNTRLDSLSLRIWYEFDLSKARKDVYHLLGHLLGLSRKQKFDIGEIILQKVKHLDFFLGMQDDDRVAYVFRTLAKYE
ncbi:hypothetical protein SASPL_137793 [Salvia splendens]|uniref:Uncharacterized protein n=1 Tax=Salvia splendens TaxID=180675 RepID=A0A8X8ZDS4_SALSN|nr:hypothetical protein SASPL_137793 [Salvia splendens]